MESCQTIKKKAGKIRDIFRKQISKKFNENIELAKKALEDKMIINSTNKIYQGVNFYYWITGTVKRKYENNKLTKDEVRIIEQLLGERLDVFYKKVFFIKVVDTMKNKEIGVYRSTTEIIDRIQKEYGEKVNRGTIHRRINNNITIPYKGRFMFYYATDEEVKKYLEENKAN